ncbi:hypothetical protein GE21DRAFT_5419 [Neurospora crassa]|uniref:Uncharacterized protein n=1 Tax=Neurospora crassa (strain ATCC 24698 / 74-OR23-1A / CBS 708.71 / DSM 1257 / FGSC 987) TaxID=367110 RepID=Q7S3Q5_NEUCR|nr:hypothetical protein NCU04962 [Neurospora crassa OR74A]EAA30174.1 hypothetical protein NCU04962 [Neurospora crassa OR74A]KHE81576.1 hypothetical protein GE21DRAFT_5419 [Neurospora crassa]|eukprot:XP_959410.1 hypothetical protein NCU04962 [Neurospora crassa OR74A]
MRAEITSFGSPVSCGTRQAVSCPCRSVCPSLKKQEGGSCADAMCTHCFGVKRWRGTRTVLLTLTKKSNLLAFTVQSGCSFARQTPCPRIWPYPELTLLSRPVADSRGWAVRQLCYHLPSDSSTAWQNHTVHLPQESPSDVAAF